jgi:hypothetical protein
MASGRVSRRSSGWGEITGDEEEKGERGEGAEDKTAVCPEERNEDIFDEEPKMN